MTNWDTKFSNTRLQVTQKQRLWPSGNVTPYSLAFWSLSGPTVVWRNVTCDLC